ncbi:MAG: GTPase [Candidatus Zixiibacteriota bacterium]
MPANLPPQYYELEREFRAEKDTREKLRMAEELLRIMPKHKGTDKLQAEMKAKISLLKKQLEAGDKKHGQSHAVSHDHIEREGAGQVILIGAPNSGKSSLLEALTHARPLVADYPYTTREPMAGMMTFETIQVQLIDTPPIGEELFEPYLPNLVRNADLVMLVCDVTDSNMSTGAQHVTERLREKHVLLRPTREVSEDARFYIKKTVICAHKANEDDNTSWQGVLSGRFPGFPVVATSLIDDASLVSFKRVVFDGLEIIRVYTKQIGKEVALVDPVILPVGATVIDAATSIHKDFAAKLKVARIWGSGKFEGQRVQHDHQLSDGDVVEFHI